MIPYNEIDKANFFLFLDVTVNINLVSKRKE